MANDCGCSNKGKMFKDQKKAAENKESVNMRDYITELAEECTDKNSDQFTEMVFCVINVILTDDVPKPL